MTPGTRNASAVSMRLMRPFAMVEFDDIAMHEAGDVELAGIFGLAGDLGPAVDAGCR